MFCWLSLEFLRAIERFLNVSLFWSVNIYIYIYIYIASIDIQAMVSCVFVVSLLFLSFWVTPLKHVHKLTYNAFEEKHICFKSFQPTNVTFLQLFFDILLSEKFTLFKWMHVIGSKFVFTFWPFEHRHFRSSFLF